MNSNERQEITCISTVCSAADSDWHQRKHRSPAPLAFCEGNPPMDGRFPSQKAVTTEIVSMSCHNELGCATPQWRDDTFHIADTLWGESISHISGFPHKGPLMWSFGVFFVVSPNRFSNSSLVTLMAIETSARLADWMINDTTTSQSSAPTAVPTASETSAFIIQVSELSRVSRGPGAEENRLHLQTPYELIQNTHEISRYSFKELRKNAP